VIPTVLVVDDDDGFRALLLDILRLEGYRLLAAASAEQALSLLERDRADLVLTDRRLPGLDGLELARRLRAQPRPPVVVLVTAYGTIPEAVAAVRAGVADYLTKPLESPAALRRRIRDLLGEPAVADGSGEFLTGDPRLAELVAMADRAAATDATVLVTGESGTGKELLARRIHARSRRADRPWVALNCAALPESLAESELFGHEKGAFTGALARHRGRFEQADGGTLFLDEIGDLSPAIQAKLLRALEERKIQRLGGTEPVAVDLRLVAATHRDLAMAAATGEFRSDLYYRLNVVALAIPPLRERPGDIALLAPRLLSEATERLGLPARRLAPEALAALTRHSWPGNVRELRNAVERAAIAASGETIEPRHLPELGGAPSRPAVAPLSLEQRERQAILAALERTGGHREQAAELLGISVRTLYNRLRTYGIR
jgi:two-component system response regulator FlrC